MGKKNKHSKDKLHKTVAELSSHHIGSNRDLELSILHRRLKFDSCCLSLNTISGKPMGLSDNDGFCYVFECDLIIKFLEKFQIHPITGGVVTAHNLIELKFHKNNEGHYHCPVVFKLFNQHSKIVTNRKTGHVYSYEAYQQLNLKPNNLNDLLTDEPFEKDDILMIQDPERADEKWNVTDFHYVKHKLRIDDDSGESNIRNIEQSSILKASLEEYKRQADTIAETFNRIVGQTDVGREVVPLDKINSATYSDGTLSRSVTSTVMPVAISQRAATLDKEQILYPRIKKKGYIQLMTNFGPINLELYCDRTPKTCHNFLLLASQGYYDNTCFHRLVKNFILQGGDPTGSGSGGQSAFGEPFKDEIHADLKHIGRGVLAMANSGPGSNKSQFYITLRGTWDHLDGKHTIFGRVVGGDETLDRIESVEVDKKYRPKKEVKILRVVKYVDPFEEVEAALDEERKKEIESKKRSVPKPSKQDEQPLKKFRAGVGIYINLDRLQQISPNSKSVDLQVKAEESEERDDTSGKEPTSLTSKLASLNETKQVNKSFGDFSNW